MFGKNSVFGGLQTGNKHQAVLDEKKLEMSKVSQLLENERNHAKDNLERIMDTADYQLKTVRTSLKLTYFTSLNPN